MGKLSATYIRLIVLVLAAIGIVVAIMYGFTPINEKVEEVEAENTTLQNEIDVLKGYAANEKQMRADIEKIDNTIGQIADSYTAEVTSEDSIKIVRDMEVASGTEVSSIGFGEQENIYASTFTNADGENVIANVTPVTIQYSTSYSGLKQMFNYINEYPRHMNVREFNAAYNQETGKLTGTMVINRYSVTGLGGTYTPPDINGISISTNNIFHTIE